MAQPEPEMTDFTVSTNCNFFAGYPITPASTVFHHMLDLVPATGGVAIQGEDEIASMGLCIGAAMAGSKAMTATSGPGMPRKAERKPVVAPKGANPHNFILSVGLFEI